ncbi:pro-neuregulin-1, membrane-bound isoform isoform X2 [Triplophysa rosa]|uniref:pro-neuregulin-1, membrane-bound isoform isoform X2 n=1 Tax=Triplophysa rosa TaxID=992332 RepID=UPI0025462308|nr:pro-neuregulin-1, membrane-bound isoform isoform X2 [Triplophysa rosa]
MKSEATEDISAGLPSQEALSEVLSEVSAKEPTQGEEEDVAGDGDSSERGPLGCLLLPAAACCVCLELEQVRNCVRSEKICILPILACLLSLALCTAGLKWVFVDKIFEYEPPSHLDLKRIGQDPNLNLDPTASVSAPTFNSTPTTANVPGQPKVFVEGESTGGPFEPPSTKVPVFTSTAAATFHTDSASPPSPKSTFRPPRNDTSNQYPSQTLESNNILPRTSATSTTPSAKTSSHVTPCSESERNYCVNGGKCFTLEVTPGKIHRLCRCPNEFTGDRCQNYVMASFYKHLGIEFMAEELYQKRVLTITGICIALLVVGIMCVVAYCKTKKQRKKLQDRLRQSLREHNAVAKSPPHPPPENLQLVNHCVSNTRHGHVTEKEAETSLSTSDFTTHASTAVINLSSPCWSHGQTDSVDCDSHAVAVKSSVEKCCHHVTPVQRVRLNATGGSSHQMTLNTSSRDSGRYVSAVTTPTHLSPGGLLSPVTPSSPPSEMSAPLSSLALSIPSMATSPSGEEERPLLFRTPPILRDKSGSNPAQRSGHNLRNSAHYNHGLELLSPPASPLHVGEDGGENVSSRQPSPPHSPSDHAQRTQQTAEASPASASNSESSGSESEDEDTPFLGSEDPLGGVCAGSVEGSRTKPALHLSAQEHLQNRLPNIIVNQDPIAV